MTIPSKSNLTLLEKALRKNRNIKLIWGLFLLGLAVFLTFYLNRPLLLPAKTAFLFLLFCIILAFSGGYLLLNAVLRYDIHKNSILKTIREEPQKIAWVYTTKIEYFPFGIKFMDMCSLHIHLTDYDKMVLFMQEKELKKLNQLLKMHLPQTTFGYSKQREQLYDISPDLLREENEGKV